MGRLEVFRGVLGVYMMCVYVSRVYIGVNIVIKVYKRCIKGII